MEIKQVLNNYTDKYKTFDWNIFESEHYIFYVNKNSEASKDIKLITKTQENAHKKITKELKLNNKNKKINYYLYSSEKQKES